MGEALTTNPSTKRAFSIKEVVALTSIGRTRIFQEIADGRLKAHKLGQRTVVLAHDVEQWLAALPAVTPRNAGQRHA